MKDAPARYSDEVPYEKRKYWYFTTHGVGPGAIPKDLKVLEIREGQNDKGTWGEYVCLDGILNTDELSTFNMRELKPPMNDGSMRDDAWVEKYLVEHNFDQHGSTSTVHMKVFSLMKMDLIFVVLQAIGNIHICILKRL